MRRIQLYIHIPFCVKKCAYCDFLSFCCEEDVRESYCNALIKEIETHKEFGDSCTVKSIFIGGGTPSILNVEQISSIMHSVYNTFALEQRVEITIEMNPGTVDEEKVEAYKRLGINRVSIGLQATNNNELKLLGRIHTMETFLDTYHLVKKCGIENINIDLISAIPGQTIETWSKTLKDVIELEPTHISAYSLIIEEGTKFYDSFDEFEELLPSEEDERKIYELTKSLLSEAGYGRYEISNYAKKGYECNHNLGYWERAEYLGLGLGSSSLLGEIRIKNEENLERYIEKCEHTRNIQVAFEELSEQNQIEEFLFLGLRKMEGISKTAFRNKFGVSVESIYGEKLQKMIQKQLLKEENDNLKLSDKGIDVSNQIFAEFLL